MIQSAEEFVRLRTSERRDEYSLAATDSAPLAVWLDVINRFPEMREWVVHNKTVPMAVLRILAQDTDRRVRAAVADKRKLDDELIELLSWDSDEVVRQRIAINRSCSHEVLRRLYLDDSELVRSAAIKSLQSK